MTVEGRGKKGIIYIEKENPMNSDTHEKGKPTPVTYVGRISFNGMAGVDVGTLEGHASTCGLVSGIGVKKGYYDCFYAMSEDGMSIGALIVVNEEYEGDSLTAPEKIGEFAVGLSGIVGFFASPKTEYTLRQLGNYIGQIERRKGGRVWYELNTSQFLCPSSQAPATTVEVRAHRTDGTIDALQIEFNRAQNDVLAKGVEEA